MNGLVESFWQFLFHAVEDVGRSKESKHAPRNSMTEPDALFEEPFSIDQV